MTKQYKWGIVGCGGIAGTFAKDLQYTKGGKLHAVASRRKAKAAAFAKTHKAAVAYGSYDQLVADPDVDIVYVATPHPMHMENALTAIKAGKHVLCEKPIAMNAAQTKRMIAAAQKKGVFLMEAMWMRFFPAIGQVQKWIADGRIGQVQHIEADFGIHFRVGPKHRLFNPALGGGALLDLGIYPVAFASMIYGAQPEKIISTVHKAKTGVDDHATIIFEYPNSATAALTTSSIVKLKNDARIFGTDGLITLDGHFFHPKRITVEVEGWRPVTKDYFQPGTGMHFEAQHVHDCLRKDQIESDIFPLSESLAIMQTMDKIRRQWKLKYACE
jgi:predicted dehydrogenase